MGIELAGGQVAAVASAATTRCWARGRCAGRSSARSRTHLSEKILFGELKAGQIVIVDADGEGAGGEVHLQGRGQAGRGARRPAGGSSRRSGEGRHRPGQLTGRRPADAPGTAQTAAVGRSSQAQCYRGRAYDPSAQPADQAVGDQGSERTALAALSSCQAASRRLAGHRAGGGPQHGQQRAPALPVGALVALAHRPGRRRRAARRSHAQSAATGQRRAARPGRRADQRAEFHHRRPTSGRPPRPSAGSSDSASRHSAADGPSAAGLRPGDQPASTRRTLVSRTGVPLAESEAGDRGRGVTPDTRQRPAARRAEAGYRAAMLGHQDPGASCSRRARRG